MLRKYFNITNNIKKVQYLINQINSILVSINYLENLRQVNLQAYYMNSSKLENYFALHFILCF